MNVCFATRFYPPDTGGGGIAAYTWYVARGLVQRGHRVCVISQLAPHVQSKPFQEIDGINVYRIPAAFRSHRWTRLPIIGRHVRFLRDVAYALRVRKTLISLESSFIPDIVEYADIDAEGLFHVSLFPYVVKLHTSHAILKHFYTNRQASYAMTGIAQLEKHVIRRADGVSSPSRWLAQEATRLYGLDDSGISRVINPIDTDYYSPDVISEDTNPALVLYVGRLESRKGAMVFAQAIPIIAKACTNVRFVFLGADRPNPSGTSQQAELEAYLEQVGVINLVQFHGHASQETFRDFYRRATVFVMPSLFENCPYTLLEAMACGKPVVVSRAGGMIEMIDDGETGILFDAGDSEALAEATITLLGSSRLRSELGRAGREAIIRGYSLPVGAAATEQFYQRVLHQHTSLETS